MRPAARRPLSLASAWILAALSMHEPACSSAACQTAESCSDAGKPKAAAAPHVPRVVEADAACAMQSAHAQRGPAKRVDIIFVIDNSGSMADEISAVRDNINTNFAQIIEQSGVDYRVILISLYGNGGTSVCIEPPLAGASCEAGLGSTNSDVFFHYNAEIASNDAFCRILDTFDKSDAEQRAPNGWQAWLRSDAEKEFVLITDDSAICSYKRGKINVQFGGEGADPFEDALSFHQALLQKSPEQFGVPPDIKYQFFSIVGLQPNVEPREPYFPYQALNSASCDTAPSPGLSYQALSVVTDALRYPVCDGRGFDAVFQVLARSVIEASKAACVFELPMAPPHQSIDLVTANLEYHPGDGSAVQRFGRVESSDACKNEQSFFVHDRIELCPQACAAVQADPGAEIDILYACSIIPE